MDEKKLFKAAMARQSMSVDRMLQVLLSDGVVECNSPKNRYRLYRKLKELNIRYESTIIGYTGGQHSVGYWSYNTWTPSKLAKWILNKRLTKDAVRRSYQLTNEAFPNHYRDFADIEAIFDAKDRRTIMEILNNAYDKLTMECDKIHPLNHHLYIGKTIARISLLQ